LRSSYSSPPLPFWRRSSRPTEPTDQYSGVRATGAAMALSVKEREYVLAARCLGVPSGRIMTRHILPNSMTALIVQATLGIATRSSRQQRSAFSDWGRSHRRPSGA